MLQSTVSIYKSQCVVLEYVTLCWLQDSIFVSVQILGSQGSSLTGHHRTLVQRQRHSRLSTITRFGIYLPDLFAPNGPSRITKGIKYGSKYPLDLHWSDYDSNNGQNIARMIKELLEIISSPHWGCHKLYYTQIDTPNTKKSVDCLSILSTLSPSEPQSESDDQTLHIIHCPLLVLFGNE